MGVRGVAAFHESGIGARFLAPKQFNERVYPVTRVHPESRVNSGS